MEELKNVQELKYLFYDFCKTIKHKHEFLEVDGHPKRCKFCLLEFQEIEDQQGNCNHEFKFVCEHEKDNIIFTKYVCKKCESEYIETD